MSESVDTSILEESKDMKHDLYNYLIFLPDKYFKKNKRRFLCWKYRRGIVDDLEEKGVKVLPKSLIKDFKREYPRAEFNDSGIPEINTLYIRLLNDEYYSDELYTKRKTVRERDILFLLAGKLGVSTITYSTELIETTLTKASVSTNVKEVNVGTTYTKTVNSTKGQNGTEEYLNRGAPVYILSKNINHVEDNIKRKFDRLGSKIFSYDFYRMSDRLQAFVYKRFNFKMLSVEYTTEEEDIVDYSFSIKTTLMNYGIGIQFDKNVKINERVTFNLKFFTDKELRLKLNEIIRLKDDPFAGIREVYDSEENKEIAVHRICEYVKILAANMYYGVVKQLRDRDMERVIEYSFANRLDRWIRENADGSFENICHTFTSTYQIKTWIRSALGHDDDIVPEDSNAISVENYGIMGLRNRQHKRYKKNIMNEDSESDDGTEDLAMHKEISDEESESDDELLRRSVTPDTRSLSHGSISEISVSTRSLSRSDSDDYLTRNVKSPEKEQIVEIIRAPSPEVREIVEVSHPVEALREIVHEVPVEKVTVIKRVEAPVDEFFIKPKPSTPIAIPTYMKLKYHDNLKRSKSFSLPTSSNFVDIIQNNRSSTPKSTRSLPNVLNLSHITVGLEKDNHSSESEDTINDESSNPQKDSPKENGVPVQVDLDTWEPSIKPRYINSHDKERKRELDRFEQKRKSQCSSYKRISAVRQASMIRKQMGSQATKIGSSHITSPQHRNKNYRRKSRDEYRRVRKIEEESDSSDFASDEDDFMDNY